MSQRSSANVLNQLTRSVPAGKLLNSREFAIIVLVLVLLITNGGAG